MKKLIFILSLFFLPISAFSQNNIHEFHLKNGLTLLVRVDTRAPVVFSSVWYKVGGSYEHDGITGISHVLEHMMFRGTKRFPGGQLEKMVSENGGEQNAMTSSDFTAYYQKLSADKLSMSFMLEADRMHNLVLNAAVFKKEMQVIMEERRMRLDNSPQSQLYERLMATTFVNNPYHHPVIGWPTDLRHMKLSDVKKWYDTWYAPNNAAVIVVGDVKPDAVLALAKKYFGPLKPSIIPKLNPRAEIAQMGVKKISLHLPAKLPMLMMAYQTPSLDTTKKQWQSYALTVLSAMLGGTASSRFNLNLVRGKQIASVADSYYSPIKLHSTALILAGVPAQGHTVKELKKAFVQQIKFFKKDLVSQAELRRIKAQVVAGNTFKLDSLYSQALELGTYSVINLPWQLSQHFLQKVEAVTPEQIQMVAKMYLKRKRLTIAVLHPINKKIKD